MLQVSACISHLQACEYKECVQVKYNNKIKRPLAYNHCFHTTKCRTRSNAHKNLKHVPFLFLQFYYTLVPQYYITIPLLTLI